MNTLLKKNKVVKSKRCNTRTSLIIVFLFVFLISLCFQAFLFINFFSLEKKFDNLINIININTNDTKMSLESKLKDNLRSLDFRVSGLYSNKISKEEVMFNNEDLKNSIEYKLNKLVIDLKKYIEIVFNKTIINDNLKKNYDDEEMDIDGSGN